jgi:hypothetical protein
LFWGCGLWFFNAAVVRAFTAIFLLEGKKDFRSIPQPVGFCMKGKSENVKIRKYENEK